jgi:sugar phosphate isomerase/epimerase
MGASDFRFKARGRNIGEDNMFLSALKEIGYDADVSVQVHTGYPIDIDAWTIESKEYLDGVLKQL